MLTSSQKLELQEVLTELGLRPHEQSIYLGLLQLGPTTTSPLSQRVRLPLTTTQSIIQRLVLRGFVLTSARKSRHLYEALPPGQLKAMMEDRLREVIGIVPLLEHLQKEDAAHSRVHIYYRDRVTEVLNEANSCTSKHIYEIVAARSFQELIGERYHMTRRRLKNHVRLSSLRVEHEEIKKYSRKTHERELREAKFLPRALTFHANIMFWDNSVAFFSSKADGVTVVIESKTIREMIQQIFQLLWEISRPMETVIATGDMRLRS